MELKMGGGHPTCPGQKEGLHRLEAAHIVLVSWTWHHFLAASIFAKLEAESPIEKKEFVVWERGECTEAAILNSYGQCPPAPIPQGGLQEYKVGGEVRANSTFWPEDRGPPHPRISHKR